MTNATLQPLENSPRASSVTDADDVEVDRQTLSILSLVSALVGIASGAVVPFSIVALILGVLALSREPRARTLAIWGIVLGGVPSILALLAGLVALAIFVPLTAIGVLGGF